MSKFGNFYRRNIYGIIGTLVFHILLFMAFLLADMDIKGNMKEQEILIEFPDEVLEQQELQPEETQQSENANEPSSDNNIESRTTNRASNRLASTNDFFDEEYQREVENARKLSSDVRNQLSKEVIDLDDVKMPVENTEGMNPDSIKNVIYTGDSNIEYFLENRYHVRLPIPVYLAQGGGKVVVDILVNQQGKVIEANARKNPSIKDNQIYSYAELAASNTLFNTDYSAPSQQSGTISYLFIAQ